MGRAIGSYTGIDNLEVMEVATNYRHYLAGLVSARVGPATQSRSTDHALSSSLATAAAMTTSAASCAPTATACRILITTIRLFRELRPLHFLGIFFLLLTATATVLAVPVVDEYIRTGLVLRLPTGILAAAVQTVPFICLTCGLVLQSVVTARKEARRLAYLQVFAPPAAPPAG